MGWKEVEAMAFELIDANKRMSRTIDKLYGVVLQYVAAEELDKQIYEDMEKAAQIMKNC